MTAAHSMAAAPAAFGRLYARCLTAVDRQPAVILLAPLAVIVLPIVGVVAIASRYVGIAVLTARHYL